MKKPKEHAYSDEYGGVRCEADGQEWPCKTWRKWMKTPEYRIGLLEKEVETLRSSDAWLRQDVDRLRQDVDRLRDKAHRVEVTMKGVWPALSDLLQGKTGGSLKVGENVEHQDFTTAGSYMAQRVAVLREPYVDYTGPDGDTYHNGQWIEREYRK